MKEKKNNKGNIGKLHRMLVGFIPVSKSYLEEFLEISAVHEPDITRSKRQRFLQYMQRIYLRFTSRFQFHSSSKKNEAKLNGSKLADLRAGTRKGKTTLLR